MAPTTPKKLREVLLVGTPKKIEGDNPFSSDMTDLRKSILENVRKCKEPWDLFEDGAERKNAEEERAAFWTRDSQSEGPAAPQCTAAEGSSDREIICLFHGNVSKSGTIELAQCKLPRGEPAPN
jgi:hypothetical protein